jgi:hypothetical protein
MRAMTRTIAMKKKETKSDQAHQKDPRDTSVYDLLDIFDETEKQVKKAAREKPKIRERFTIISRWLEVLKECLMRNDAPSAVVSLLFLEYELERTGFSKSLCLTEAGRKGGSAKKEKRGIIAAIRELLPKMKIHTPSYMRKYLAARYYDRGHLYETEDPGYDIFIDEDAEVVNEINHARSGETNADADGGLISRNRRVSRKEFEAIITPIKFKTFDNYFYKVRAEKRGLRP